VAACSYSVVAVCTTTILLALATGGMQSASTVLNFKPLAYVGKVSFGVYLLHPLVFSLTLGVWNMVGLGSPASSVTHAVAMYAVLTVAPVLVASVVFDHIEMPLLAMKDRFAPYKRAATATSTNRPPLDAPQPAKASVPAKSADLVVAAK
jgi:peptidoglycan/LPS O-acetylase OafA/YrhL